MKRNKKGFVDVILFTLMVVTTTVIAAGISIIYLIKEALSWL